jgi:adenylosuccinate synthase
MKPPWHAWPVLSESSRIAFFDILTVTSMDVYDKTDEVKEAAAGFAPVYDEQSGGFNR